MEGAVVGVEYPVDLFYRFYEAAIFKSRLVFHIFVSGGGLDKPLPVFVGFDDESVVFEFFIDERVVVVSFDSVFTEEELYFLFLPQFLRSINHTVKC